jgi:hypothetical protein
VAADRNRICAPNCYAVVIVSSRLGSPTSTLELVARAGLGAGTGCHEDNLTFLAEVIGRHGWLGSDLVGVDGASASWLMVQPSPLEY